MRNVFVMQSFCVSAHVEIGSKSIEISLTDLDREIIEMDVNKRDKVLRPAQSKYLLFSNKSFNIFKSDYLFSTIVMN